MHFSIGTSHESQLCSEPDFDVTSILLTIPSTLGERVVKTSSSSNSLRTAGRMDPTRYNGDSHRQARSRRRAPNTRQYASTGLVTQPYSSPLPQTQWSDIPLPYRPQDWVPPHPSTQPPLADRSHDWRLRPSGTENHLSASAIPEPLRTRRRPRELCQPSERDDAEQHVDIEEPTDFSLLYPAMNPYHDDQNIGYGRSVSQPSSPNFMQQQQPNPADDPHPFQMPRSPTYPPGGRRRMHSTGVGDAAFADEEEFRLFVEATAGLPPETSFRHSISVSSPSSSRRQQSRDYDMREYRGPSDTRTYSEHIVSPIEETPTTMRALQQLAQLPQATDPLRRQRLESSPSGLDLWLPSPNRAVTSVTSVTPDFSTYEEDSDADDDELPNYAASQAQAQAGQRVEAARRARELQRRWQESSGRHGF